MHFQPTANFVLRAFFTAYKRWPRGTIYTDQELEPWAEHLRRSAHQGLKGFVYFNNDVNTRAAPLNALRLIEDGVAKYAAKAKANSRVA